MAYLTTGVILYSINTKILEILIRQCLSFERVTCLTNLQLQQMYSPKCDAWCPDDAWCPEGNTTMLLTPEVCILTDGYVLTNLQIHQMYSPKCDAWCPDDAWCPSATTVREYYNAANTICADVLEWRMPDDQEGLP